MIKTISSILILVCLGYLSVVSAGDTRGVPRGDLVGKPSTLRIRFGLPLPWKTEKKYELRIFGPDFETDIVTVTELPSSGKESGEEERIVSAVEFPSLQEGEIPEQDCFYRNIPSCDGRLCDGLLIGIIDQKVISKDGTYVPTEVWKITAKSLRFEKVSPKNVICKPQSYAE